MTTALMPLPKMQFLDNNGTLLAGGKLFTYAAGTTTKQATYTDQTGSTSNANPIVLDANGRCDVWLNPNQNYKLTLSPSTDTDPPTNPLWTVDNVGGVLGGNTGESVVATIAALKALPNPGTAGNNAAVEVLGYSAANDGGGGVFYWKATDTTTDNGGTIIAPNAGGTGRWNRIYDPGEVEILWFGAVGDGSTNNDTAIAAAISSGAQRILFPAGVFNYSSKITLSNYQRLIGMGSADGGTAGTFTTLNYTGSGDAMTIYYGHMENIALRGNSNATNGITFGISTDTTVTCGRSSLRHVMINSFSRSGAAGLKGWTGVGGMIFEDVVSSNNYDGLSIPAGNLCTLWEFRACRFASNSHRGVDIRGLSLGQFHDCEFLSNALQGVYLYSNQANNISFYDPWFETNLTVGGNFQCWLDGVDEAHGTEFNHLYNPHFPDSSLGAVLFNYANYCEVHNPWGPVHGALYANINSNNAVGCAVHGLAIPITNSKTGTSLSGTKVIPTGAPYGGILLDQNQTLPRVSVDTQGFRTQNTAATQITNFIDGYDGQIVTIDINDANTTIKNGPKMVNLAGADVTSGTHSWINRAGSDSVWHQFV